MAEGGTLESDSEDDTEESDQPSGLVQHKQCTKCGDTAPRAYLIQCVRCKGYYHIGCVKISIPQALGIPNYECPPCRTITGPIRNRGNLTDQTTLDFDLLQHLKLCKSNLSIISNIPKGARTTAANALSELINDAVGLNTALSWSKLLCFAYHGLQTPQRGKGALEGPSLATKVKTQISSFMNTNFPPDNFPFRLRSGKAKRKSKEEILRNRVDAKFAEFDLKGAIRELSSDDTFAPNNEETLDLLQARHPTAPDGIALPPAIDGAEAHIQISEDSVKKAILSFQASSAGGPDGLKPAHLKSLIRANEAGNRLLESLTKLVNFVLQEKIPEIIRPIFFGANLFAFSKKEGGIRPIAVGTTLRRLITKAGLKPISHELGVHFRPTQFGFHSKGGSETAAHAARHYLTKNTQEKVFLKLDIKNAFNCMNRDIILQRVKERMPSLFNLFRQAYSEPSHLFYRDETILSKTGLQQGDPGGAALFSLGIDHIVKGIKSEMNLWYLDDSNMADSPEVVLADLRFLLGELEKIGLSINAGKCELTCLNTVDPNTVIESFKLLLPNLKVTSIDESIILGSPIADQGVRTEIESKIAALKRMTARLDLIDPHQAFVLLKHSFSIPKMYYLLRSAPAYKQADLLESYDQTVRESLSRITNINYSNMAWAQASLPVRSGGLGVRKANDIALPCYISSALTAQTLVEAIIPPSAGLASFGVDLEIEKWKNGVLTEPIGEFRMRQKSWDTPRIDLRKEALLRKADNQVTRARLLASAQPDSGSWIEVIPVPNLGTHLTPEELRIAIALRTGSRICEEHRCKCGKIVDKHGYHLLSCYFNEGRLPRHAAINDIIF